MRVLLHIGWRRRRRQHRLHVDGNILQVDDSVVPAEVGEGRGTVGPWRATCKLSWIADPGAQMVTHVACPWSSLNLSSQPYMVR